MRPSTACRRPAPVAPGRFDDALCRYVLAIVRKYIRDEDAARDAAQDALISLVRYQASYRGDAAYSTWVYRVAATAALMYLRRQRRLAREVLDRTTDGPSPLDRVPATAPSPERAVAAAERCAHALANVDALGARYGRVFRMRYGDGFTEGEIAETLATTVPTVKTRAHRALVAARADAHPRRSARRSPTPPVASTRAR